MRNHLLILMLALGACTPMATVRPTPSTAQWRTSGSNVMTRAELDRIDDTTLDRALRRLHPEYLNGMRRGLDATILLDGAPVAVDALAQVHKQEVERVEWLSAGDMAERFGTRFGTTTGLLITTRAP